MKKLEELGISPAPWKCVCYKYKHDHLGEIRFADNQILCLDLSCQDAKLAAAAPELYEGCYELLRYYEEPTPNTTVLYAALCKIRKAMSEASGEGEVAK